MIIGIDGNEANQKKLVGIGRYAAELLKQFSQIRNPLQNNNLALPRLSLTPGDPLRVTPGVFSTLLGGQAGKGGFLKVWSLEYI